MGESNQIQSPDDLDQRLIVISPRGWIALIVTSILILGILLWSIFGEIPNTLETKVIFQNAAGFEIIRSTSQGVVKSLPITRDQSVEKGQTVALIETDEEEIAVTASEKGTVVEIIVVASQRVSKGDPLMLIRKEGGKFQFFAYVPLEMEQKIEKGMEAFIQLEGVDAEDNGAILAKVVDVSYYVISKERLTKILGDVSLVNYFTQNKPVAEVILDPKENAANPSGFEWTSGKGPNIKIEPLTLGKARIILQRKRPISYVIPLWRIKKLS